MILGSREWRIGPHKPFYVLFPKDKQEQKETFLSEYDPSTGFCFEKSDKGYRIFTLSYVWFADRSRFDNKGLYITGCHDMAQNQTLHQAASMQVVRVIGLPASYFLLSDERNKPQLIESGVDELIRFADSRFHAKQQVTLVDNRRQVDFLHLHQELVNEKDEYEKSRLFIIQYHDFTDASITTQDGTVYLFQISENDEEKYGDKFKENTPVEISANDGGQNISGSIINEEDGWLHIILHNQDSFTRIAKFGEIKEKINPEYGYKKSALKVLREQTSPNKYLLPILAEGTLQPLNSEKWKTYTPKADNVNNSQKEAIEKAINVEDFLLVQGPPGTGKTTIITEMIKEFVQQGLRILICSKNNLAVDNVLEKCQKLTYGDNSKRQIQCLRLGVEEKVLETVHPCLSRPLTMRIQNDIRTQSEKVRSQYIEQETEKQKQYEKTMRNTEGICLLANYYLAIKQLAQESIKRFQSSGWTNLLQKRRKDAFLKETAFLYQQSEIMIHQLLGLIRTKSILIQDSSIQQYLHIANDLFEIIERFNAEISSAPLRYKWILEEEKQTIHESTSTLIQAKDEMLKLICSLAQYQGNPIVDELPPELLQDNISPSFVEQFHREAENQITKYKARRFMLKDVLDEWHEELQSDQSSLETPLLRTVKIIGATCIGVNTKPNFKDVEYDVAIVDEAGQITLHDLLVPLAKAKKTILIGDHLQLPPGDEKEFCRYLRDNQLLEFGNLSTQEEMNQYEQELNRQFSVSLFETLFKDPRFEQNKVLLDTQYRMHPVIATFISEQFYEGKYKSGVSADKRLIRIAGFELPMYFIDTCHASGKHEDENLEDGAHANNFEAEICAQKLTSIIVDIEKNNYTAEKPLKKEHDGYDEYDIGIITAYKKQIEFIREKTREKLCEHLGMEKTDSIVDRLAINTLDSFQGRDNQIIIYSFVRSNSEHKIGFLNEVRRLNVMMTRAKSLLIMIGDSETLTQNESLTIHDQKKASEYFGKLISYCKDQRGYIDCCQN